MGVLKETGIVVGRVCVAHLFSFICCFLLGFFVCCCFVCHRFVS